MKVVFILDNKNLKMWRKIDKEITGGAMTDSKKRINLILSFDNKEKQGVTNSQTL